MWSIFSRGHSVWNPKKRPTLLKQSTRSKPIRGCNLLNRMLFFCSYFLSPAAYSFPCVLSTSTIGVLDMFCIFFEGCRTYKYRVPETYFLCQFLDLLFRLSIWATCFRLILLDYGKPASPFSPMAHPGFHEASRHTSSTCGSITSSGSGSTSTSCPSSYFSTHIWSGI